MCVYSAVIQLYWAGLYPARINKKSTSRMQLNYRLLEYLPNYDNGDGIFSDLFFPLGNRYETETLSKFFAIRSTEIGHYTVSSAVLIIFSQSITQHYLRGSGGHKLNRWDGRSTVSVYMWCVWRCVKEKHTEILPHWIFNQNALRGFKFFTHSLNRVFIKLYKHFLIN